MRSTRNPGRVAGLWYLALSYSAAHPNLYIGKLFVHGNAAATARQLALSRVASVSASSATCSTR